MLPGTSAVPIVTPGHSKTIPIITAGIAYIAAMFVGAWLGMFQFSAAAQTAALEAVETDWTVQSGTIAIDITQFNSQVSGEFKDWTAAITFDPEVRNGPAGDVIVTIAIPSITLGSVTDQAMDADFFDADTFPTATFTAQLNALDGAYVAAGILTIKGQSLPLDFDFDLQLDGDIATVMATTDLNRLDYSVGASMPDESSLAFGVDVTINLTATQSAN
jgi:polyisoprenoid-binding protein YceI